MSLLELAQLVALFAAAGFFLIKLVEGWLIINLSLSPTVERKPSSKDGWDSLAVAVKVTKGDTATVMIDQASVTIRMRKTSQDARPSSESSSVVELAGANRLAIDPHGDVVVQQFRFEPTAIVLDSRYKLPPGESTVWSCYEEVPSGQVCLLDIVLVGHRRVGRHPAQWRSSLVSLPVQTES